LPPSGLMARGQGIVLMRCPVRSDRADTRYALTMSGRHGAVGRRAAMADTAASRG
jgi:hypothetical protein